ncbi:COBRA-like protein 7 [Linum perenne]
MAKLVITFLLLIPLLLAQPTPSPPPPPQKTTCAGVFISYAATDGGGFAIPPIDPSNQAYRFTSTLTITNNGRTELKAWRAFVKFQFDEVLVSADKALLADGTSLPAAVGNGTVFGGLSSQANLKSAIQTAGDGSQMEVQVQLIGTRFGPPPDGANLTLPANVSLINDGYVCPESRVEGRNMRWTCCSSTNPTQNPKNQPPQSILPPPPPPADLSITYDVLNTYDTNYLSQVTITNHHPLSRLDSWQLSWEWTRDEFIFSMKGAYPLSLDTSECIFGSQGQHYLDLDFSQALNCQRRPTVVDLPLTRANDTEIGRIPFCCRNGTILPQGMMDSGKSMSVFQMQVFKMPPDLNRTAFDVPVGWRIGSGSGLSSDFRCGAPVQVSPTQFPDPSGLPSTRTAVATWQVPCNITIPSSEIPKCCVSFSAFYNSSIIPCNTCSCGCRNNPSCSSNSQALFLPSQALAVPFDNRTALSLDWARINSRPVPAPLPCGDNCGVTIHWHLLSDFKDGWTVRMTLFNWGETNFEDWFAAVTMDELAVAGFEDVYSFNGTVLGNSSDTIFVQGLPGLNFLLAQRPAGNPRKEFPVPGMQQSIMSFSKKKSPGIDLVSGDGFPTKVMFNGEQCVVPEFLPSHGCRRRAQGGGGDRPGWMSRYMNRPLTVGEIDDQCRSKKMDGVVTIRAHAPLASGVAFGISVASISVLRLFVYITCDIDIDIRS